VTTVVKYVKKEDVNIDQGSLTLIQRSLLMLKSL